MTIFAFCSGAQWSFYVPPAVMQGSVPKGSCLLPVIRERGREGERERDKEDLYIQSISLSVVLACVLPI